MRPPRLALLQAMSGARRQATDPRLEALQALTGATHGAPQLPAPGQEAPAPAAAENPGRALLAAYQAWLTKSGQKVDPLLAKAGKLPPPDQPGAATGSVELLRYGGQQQPFHEITHGANAGQFAQTFKLGNGKFANVYYDRSGKRQVRVYTP